MSNLHETSKRYPRTLEEAFGPYARGDLQDPDQKSKKTSDLISIVISAIIAVTLATIAIKSLIQ